MPVVDKERQIYMLNKHENTKKSKTAIFSLLVAFFYIAVSMPAFCAPADTAKVRLMLQWMPQSQFAGYYVAFEKGIYRQHGLDVEILRGGPDRNGLKYLREGKTDFALMWLTSAIDAVDKNIPLVNVAQVINRSNLAIAAWKENNIYKVADLNGRRVSVWGDPFWPAFSAFFRANDLLPEIVKQNYTVNLFLRHGVDACAVMYYNEYNTIYQAGINYDELSVFFLKDYGVNFPEDGIYCLEETKRRNPVVCRSLAAASMEGWHYAKDHPEEALDIVMKYVNAEKLPTNRTHMKWMLTVLIPCIFPEGEADWEPGMLSEKAYNHTAQWMKQLNMIENAPTYKQFMGE